MVYRGVEPRPFESESNELADILIDQIWGTPRDPKIAFMWSVGFEPTPITRLQPHCNALTARPTPLLVSYETIFEIFLIPQK